MPVDSIRVQVVGPLASAHVLWRSRGQLHVTLIAKATFSIVPGGLMTVVPPTPVVAGDVFHHDDPTQSIRVATDLVPYLARADVLFCGLAHAVSGPTEELEARLAVQRDGHPLVDKSLRVVGDQPEGEQRRAFEVMALGYERAYGGIGSPDNPLGTGHGVSRRSPNILSPIDPERTACFAPISRAFPVRARLLPAGVPAAVLDPLASQVVEVPEGFDWAYFQSAPPDQQTSYLRGDESIVLEGLHPSLARVESRLPGVCALGRIAGARPGDDTWHPLALRADTLCIDGALQRVTLTWRGAVPLQDVSHLDRLRVQLLSSRAAVTAWWPDWDEDEGSTHGAGPRSSSGTATRHLTPAPQVERRTPGAGDTLVLDDVAPPSVGRRAATAEERIIADEPTAEVDMASLLDVSSVVDLDLDIVLSVPSIEPSTLQRGKETAAPPTERERVEEARAIPIVGGGPIAATSFSWKWEGRQGFYRTVVLKVVADLVHGGSALLRDEPPALREADETQGDGERKVVRLPGDLAPVKPRCDVVLVGHARVPEGATTAARGEVRFAFGKSTAPTSRVDQAGVSFDRRVRVFGDRVWRDIVGELLPGQPDRFDAMPLSWERAYGGPGHEVNPVGIGFPRPKTKPTHLPNLESPERPIVHPKDKVKAACFAPIPPWWTARSALRGRSDEAYQHAPPEQRLDEVGGDEAYILEGVHPTLRRIEGTLPGERARCFAAGADGTLREISLRLDAVLFESDELTVELVWRGILEVQGADAPEVASFFVKTEPIDAEPESLAACQAAFDAARSGPE